MVDSSLSVQDRSFTKNVADIKIQNNLRGQHVKTIKATIITLCACTCMSRRYIKKLIVHQHSIKLSS